MEFFHLPSIQSYGVLATKEPGKYELYSEHSYSQLGITVEEY